MKLRVLINVPDLTIIGGKANYYGAIQDKFSQDISYFTYGSRGKKEGKIGIIRRMLSDYINFYRTIKRQKIEVVLLNPSLEFNGFFRDGVFFLISRLLNVKRIVFWRGWSLEFEKVAVTKYWRFMSMSFMKAHAKIVLAKEFKAKLEAWDFENPVFLETTVVNEDLMEGLNEETLIEKFETKKDINLLFLARLERNKGIFEIIDSYKKLKPLYPELSLSIAGTGGAFDDVAAYLNELGLEDVKMLGFVQGDTKIKAFHDADMYLFPSSHGEGMPNSLLEAMGTGLPVITTANAGIKDFFEDEKMGMILDKIDEPSLTEKIESLLQNPEKRKRIGLYNFNYAYNRFRASVVARRLENVCLKVAGREVIKDNLVGEVAPRQEPVA